MSIHNFIYLFIGGNMEIEKPHVEESTLDESVLDTFVIIKAKLIKCR